MTFCDICKHLTMDSITICNDCRREQEEYEDSIVSCKNDCGETVLDGGFCSTRCKLEYEENNP